MNGIFRHLQTSDFIRAAGVARLKKPADRISRWRARRLPNRDYDIFEIASANESAARPEQR
jgi:hypothetical protein